MVGKDVWWGMKKWWEKIYVRKRDMVGKEIWLEKTYGRKRDMVGQEIW